MQIVYLCENSWNGRARNVSLVVRVHGFCRHYIPAFVNPWKVQTVCPNCENSWILRTFVPVCENLWKVETLYPDL